ncbi:MAG: hypothetical protein KDB35_15230 [Acidimicrobiales bacterium]|nr:hypothetical protein [Acidimicrobiales bacterium]MCB1249114.1 hypothetical protein [Acidimicrobiales bacterium]MCB1259049.1 hypothetical protein [Acidimicrobiales bacterium]
MTLGPTSPTELRDAAALLGHLRAAGLVTAAIDPAVGDAARLHDDLGLDSLALLEVVLLVEELGVVLDDDALTSMVTVGDLYAAAVAGFVGG